MGVSTPLSNDKHPLTYFFCSVPNGLSYEKFQMPDPVRIVDALVESLSY